MRFSATVIVEIDPDVLAEHYDGDHDAVREDFRDALESWTEDRMENHGKVLTTWTKADDGQVNTYLPRVWNGDSL